MTEAATLYASQAPADESETARQISKVCDDLRNMLLLKNAKYGDSALEPSRIFSRADPIEQIRIRIDDKLKRIANRRDDEDEDPEWDLMGYLILLRIARIRAKREGAA